MIRKYKAKALLSFALALIISVSALGHGQTLTEAAASDGAQNQQDIKDKKSKISDLEKKQAELDEKITAINNSLSTVRQNESNAEKWLKLIREYSDITELTAPLLNALIEKIVVHQGIKKPDGKLEQEVEIYYRFIGKID